MKINPYLMFDGQCEAAFTFYAQCLGGTVAMLARYSEMPESEGESQCAVPVEYGDKIMHARLEVGDQVLMGSDTQPGFPHEGVKGCSMSLNVDSIAEAERVFQALAENGTVQMALEQTFWAVRFGMLVDRFGVPWMVNCEQDQ